MAKSPTIVSYNSSYVMRKPVFGGSWKNEQGWSLGIPWGLQKTGKGRKLLLQHHDLWFPYTGTEMRWRLKKTCWATRVSRSLRVSDIATVGIMPSRQWTTKALIRLRGCPSWSTSLLLAYGINKFCYDKAQLRNQPPHDKTNKMTVHPAKTQISLGICQVWSGFAVHSMGS